MKMVSRKAALAAGLPKYYTGRPCKKGHVAERTTSNWMCVECTAEHNHSPAATAARAALAVNYKGARRDRYAYGTAGWARRAKYAAMQRAARDKVPFDGPAVDEILARAPTHCPVFGIELKVGGEHRDSSPSIDRVIPAKGYTRGNVAVISDRANRIKNNATIEELEKLTHWLKKWKSQ